MGGGARNLLAYEKALKWQILKGSLARRLIIRGFIFGIAIAALPVIQFLCDFDPLNLYPIGFNDCRSDSSYSYPNSFMDRVLRPVTANGSPHCSKDLNLTVDVVRVLLDHHLLNYGSRALCVGPDSGSSLSALRELGFPSVDWVYRHPFFFTRKEKEPRFNQLNYKDSSFDFLIARDLEKVSIPALIISEMERVLRPGGIAAVILHNDATISPPFNLVRSAMPVSTYLKGSTVVHVSSLSPKNTLVAFKKNFDHISLLVDEHQLPADCASLRRNKPYIDQMEPILEDRNGTSEFAYLPEFLGMTSTSGMQLVYVDMGKREVANFSNSNWFLPSYPIDSRAFNVYIVDHNALVMSSYVQKPGVNFIYHPGLSENVEPTSESESDEDTEEIPVDEEEFDFLAWFKETVTYSDLVVLKMNAGRAQLKFLSELFESGVICSVDELFLECSDSDLADENREGKLVGTCADLFKKLRSTGLFVHQWWSN